MNSMLNLHNFLEGDVSLRVIGSYRQHLQTLDSPILIDGMKLDQVFYFNNKKRWLGYLNFWIGGIFLAGGGLGALGFQLQTIIFPESTAFIEYILYMLASIMYLMTNYRLTQIEKFYKLQQEKIKNFKLGKVETHSEIDPI